MQFEPEKFIFNLILRKIFKYVNYHWIVNNEIHAFTRMNKRNEFLDVLNIIARVASDIFLHRLTK